MPVRGSAIGASWGASVFGGTGGATGRAISPTTAAVYPAQGQAGGTGKWGGVSLYLVVMVLLEAAALIALRHGFRHHHGG